MRTRTAWFTTVMALSFAACGGEDAPTDRSLCDVSSTFPQSVDWANYPLYPSCSRPVPTIDPDVVTVITSAEDFASTFACDIEEVEVDFIRARIAVVAFPENPQAEVIGAHVDGDRVRLQLGAPRYCGGIEPESSVLVVALPSGEQEIYAERCIWGACEGPDRP